MSEAEIEIPQSPERVARFNPLAMPFIASLGIGTAWIVFALPFPKTVLIGLMAAFAGTIISKQQNRGMQRELADAFYYLGFSFTMCSLVFSLNVFGIRAGAEFQPRDLLQNFGTGLITTVVGIVGRIVIRLLESSPVENVDRANQQVVDLAENFLQNFEKLNRQSSEMLSGTVEKVGRDLATGSAAIAESLGGFQAEINRMTDEFKNTSIDVEPLRKAFAEINQSAKATSSSVKKKLDQYQETHDEMIGRLQGMAEASEAATKNISEGMKDLHASLYETCAALSQASKQMSEASAAMPGDTLKTLDGSVAEAVAGVKKLSSALEESSNIKGSLDGLNSKLDMLQKRLEKSASQLEPLLDLKDMQDSIAGVTGTAKELSKAIDEIKAALETKIEKF